MTTNLSSDPAVTPSRGGVGLGPLGVYASAAQQYWDAGWRGILPIRSGAKQPLVAGHHGNPTTKPDTSLPDVLTLVEDYPDANIALRMPGTVVGVDVDAYDDKTGGRTLDEAVRRWGPLPATWMSTARDDGSGIRLFTVPDGTEFGGGIKFSELGIGDVDIIWRGNRFAVTAPSIHRSGRPYRWIQPDGAESPTLPGPGDFPPLPTAWLDALRRDPEPVTADGDAAPVTATSGSASGPVTRELGAAVRDLATTAGSRHDLAATHLMKFARLAEQGWSGVNDAVDTFRGVFLNSVTADGSRTPTEAGAEFERAWAGALTQVAQRPTPPPDTNIVRLAAMNPPAAAQAAAPTPTDPPAATPIQVVEPHRGQLRIAYRLANRYAGELLHVTGIGWHAWDGQRWAVDDTGRAQRAVLTILRDALAESLGDKDLQADVRRCESAAGVTGVLTLAASMLPFARTVRDLDADPYLLNTASGTLDLRTGLLRPHDPADHITKVTRAGYDPQALNTAWTRFLDRVLPDPEVRGYMQRVAGVALLGKVTEHILAILTGTGANGKGTFYKATCWALGDYASTAEPDLFMHRQGAHPTGEMDLLGRRLVVVSESEKDRRLAESTMKRLTGGDTIRARRMRQDFVEFEPSHTPLLITNHLPKVSGDDPAIWRRLRVIPFEVEIPPAERDTLLDERLQAEADAVLAWAVAGWHDYRRRGALNEPPAVLVATDRYQKASDAVARFIDECCTTSSPALRSLTAQLFTAWEKWRADDGSEVMSQKAFGLALDEHGFPVTSRTRNGRWRTGIGLVAEVDDDVA